VTVRVSSASPLWSAYVHKPGGGARTYALLIRRPRDTTIGQAKRTIVTRRAQRLYPFGHTATQTVVVTITIVGTIVVTYLIVVYKL